jgi:hypothetical protein
MDRAMRLEVVMRGAYRLLVEMERAGALRLPFPDHQERMAEIRHVLGIRE